MKTLPTILASLLVVATLAACDSATVERVVDGDTIDVKVDGETVRVRLLNIDTPETVDPDQPVECLGPEATEFLEGLLPQGTEVGLEYDEERTDSYGRTLAGVYLEDKTLVNAEIARQGLAEPLVVGDNDRFYPEVLAATEEARSAERGLFSPEIDCTMASDVAKLEQRADDLLAQQPTSGADLGKLAAYSAAVATALAAGTALDDLLDDDALTVRAWGDDGRQRLERRVTSVEDRLGVAADRTADRRAAEKERIAAERAAKAKAAAEKAAAEKAAAEKVAKAEAAAAEVAAARAAEEPSSGSSSGSSGSSGSGSSSGSSGGSSSAGAFDPTYTGCRAYGSSGAWIDDNGNTYDKIDCTTKAVIG